MNWATPISTESCGQDHDSTIKHNSFFTVDKEQAERNVEAAREMLIHAQREADLAKKMIRRAGIQIKVETLEQARKTK